MARGAEGAGREARGKKELRRRLVEALALAIEEQGRAGGGYSSVTVADIVRHAQTSKRSFYELFGDKDECLLAAYRGLAEAVIRGIEAAFVHAARKPGDPWDARLQAAANAYLTALCARPLLTQTFLLEIHTAGAAALDVRRSVHLRFAALISRLVELARDDHPALAPLSPPMAIALVGGINELVLVSLESRRDARLSGVAGAVSELVRRVVGGAGP